MLECVAIARLVSRYLVFAITAEAVDASANYSVTCYRAQMWRSSSFRSKAVVWHRDLMQSLQGGYLTEDGTAELIAYLPPAPSLRILAQSSDCVCKSNHCCVSTSVAAFVADLPQTCVILDQRL